MDRIYFLRSSTSVSLEQTPKAAIYDMDTKFRTSHDPLLRSYLANKLYYDYASKKLELTRKINEPGYLKSSFISSFLFH